MSLTYCSTGTTGWQFLVYISIANYRTHQNRIKLECSVLYSFTDKTNCEFRNEGPMDLLFWWIYQVVTVNSRVALYLVAVGWWLILALYPNRLSQIHRWSRPLEPIFGHPINRQASVRQPDRGSNFGIPNFGFAINWKISVICTFFRISVLERLSRWRNQTFV